MSKPTDLPTEIYVLLSTMTITHKAVPQRGLEEFYESPHGKPLAPHNNDPTTETAVGLASPKEYLSPEGKEVRCPRENKGDDVVEEFVISAEEGDVCDHLEDGRVPGASAKRKMWKSHSNPKHVGS